MNVTQITGDGLKLTQAEAISNAELQNEYEYLLAEQLTGNLLSSGLITEEEYEKIMIKNRASFRPFFSRITG